jgi:Rrf2 family protein
MMLVTREADYAIRCVLEVAKHGRISAAEVARIRSISPTFLGKIVQTLAKAGILSTRRGVGGGISLAVPPEQITLLQVIEAVEGPIALNDCLGPQPNCLHVDSCPAYPYLCEAQVALRNILDVSIADMVVRLEAVPTVPPAIDPLTLVDVAPNGRTPATLPVAEGDPR